MSLRPSRILIGKARRWAVIVRRVTVRQAIGRTVVIAADAVDVTAAVVVVAAVDAVDAAVVVVAGEDVDAVVLAVGATRTFATDFHGFRSWGSNHEDFRHRCAGGFWSCIGGNCS
jgi:hypothetical protein